MEKRANALLKLMLSMLIFGSIGLFVRYIPLPSSIIAFARAFIGVVFLLIVLVAKHSKLSASAIKQNFLVLFLSGAAIGFNWILLFESYKYTTVAVSTLCYYMAPIIVTLLSPIVLKERISIKRFLCVIIAIAGMALISGIFKTSALQQGGAKGIVFGFGAAILYATVILLNKKLKDIDAMERTVCQLVVSAVVLLPYILLAGDTVSLHIAPLVIVLLTAVGIIHTGLAYYLYFGSMQNLSGQSISIASYIDPVVAVFISVTILCEPFDIYTIIGAAAILGAALVSELPSRKGNRNDN